MFDRATSGPLAGRPAESSSVILGHTHGDLARIFGAWRYPAHVQRFEPAQQCMDADAVCFGVPIRLPGSRRAAEIDTGRCARQNRTADD
jgi:hypothetical protein